ncbi:MAG: SAM-dependent methyltransferase [Candidatus Sericytochromatia bacterium]
MTHMWYDSLLENDRLPDWMIRQGMHWYNQQHLKRLGAGGPAAAMEQKQRLFTQLREAPLAVATDIANQQHYEVPAAFFAQVLGPHLKYSCGYWKSPSVTLAQSEADMLELCCQRAQLANGQTILELGCGWGSLTLYMAARYPDAQIVGVSNSQSQREWILARAAERGLTNLTIRTADINDFEPDLRFERIVSVEMFEHLRNYSSLFERLQKWLTPGGLLFVHIFAHKKHAYLFEATHPRDWMARYFFTGGTMPSQDLLPHFAPPLQLRQLWEIDGTHYQRTANAWLARMDQHKASLFPVIGKLHGDDQALKWWSYWRIFFLACAELFGYDHGQEWQVVHYLFEQPA